MSAGPIEMPKLDEVSTQGPAEVGALVVLCSHNEADVGRVFRLGNGYRTLVGRSDSCDCILQESSVSRVHLSIEQESEQEHGDEAGQFYVVDRCSTYGTYLNNDGRPIEREPLRSGDRIRAGGVVLKYLRGEASAVEGRLLQTLGQLAFSDALTGTLKAEALLLKLRRRLASEPIERVAVFSVELRDLARVNERYGLIAGDMVLAELAQRIRDVTAREGGQGHVARIGAGRFLAFKLLPRGLRDLSGTPTLSRTRAADPLPAIEHELRQLPVSVDGQSLYPELVVEAIDAFACATTPPEELEQRLRAGALHGKATAPKTSSGLICLSRQEPESDRRAK